MSPDPFPCSGWGLGPRLFYPWNFYFYFNDFLKIINFAFFAETATVDTLTLLFVQKQCEGIIKGYKLAEMKNGRT